jgi:uncharacterized protein YndB with AHSA1/START domain
VGRRSEASVEIAAPPERVFEWLVDPERYARFTGMEPEWLPADRSALRKGYRGVEIEPLPNRTWNPKMEPAPTEVEVMRYEPPFVFDSRFKHRFATTDSNYRLEATPTGTRIRLISSWRYHGMTRLWGFLIRLRGVDPGEAHREASEELLAKLKGLVESEGAA